MTDRSSRGSGAADYEVVAFARALGVRGDWLLGLTDDKTP